MSDDATAPSKRNRKATNTETEKPAEKNESKKRPRKVIKRILFSILFIVTLYYVVQETKETENGDADGVAAPKRGRGRPKGSTKKKSFPKSSSGKIHDVIIKTFLIAPTAYFCIEKSRRGRSKKEEKDKDSEGEENEENDADEDDQKSSAFIK